MKNHMLKLIFNLIFCILVLISLAFVSSGSFLIQKTAFRINSNNNPPNPPEISGPISGKILETILYNFTLTDPDENDRLLKLEIDFGDGIISEECGCDTPWLNGEVIPVDHRWNKQGNYKIIARCADSSNTWSEWSQPLLVSMPKNNYLSNTFLHFLLLKIT
jgi:hypothetical protein